MTQRVILFRYHDFFDVCENRIALLRALNPGTPIWGLYGGAARADDNPLRLDEDFLLPARDDFYNWEHGDLCLINWFQERGRFLPFDVLHVIEWDMILLRPVGELLAHVTDGVALTDLKTLAQHRAEDWGWITDPKRAAQFDELCALIKKRYGVVLDREHLKAGPFGGCSMGRTFLQRYSDDDIPLLLHDEIRPAAFAAAYGEPLRDTGLRQKAILWNCSKNYYTPEQIAAMDPAFTVVHPVKAVLDVSNIIKNQCVA